MPTVQLTSDTRPHLSQAIAKDTILTVTATSASDVYLHVLPDSIRNMLLGAGDSVYLDAKTTVRIFLFRKVADGQVYSADLDFAEVP